MPPTGCLIIVPRDRSALYERLVAQFAGQDNVRLRLDGRSGEEALQELELFAIGGGDLDPGLRAQVEEQIRRGAAS